MIMRNLLDRANALHAGRRVDQQFPRPTSHSIAKISEHFGMTLPASLREFVVGWRSSGSWFAGFGPDYHSRDHVIRINSYWRRRRKTRRLPRHFVIVNRGFDEDCDCLDLTTFDPVTGEYAIRYWSPGISDGEVHGSFPEYADALLKYWEAQAGGR
jgi:hypothetical protein